MDENARLEQAELQATHQHVTQRIIRGALALGVRQVCVHASNVGGSILLARLLTPADYGIYAVVTFFIVFLGAFGGTGLAANLIREHPVPSKEIFRAVYSFQQVFVLILAAAFWSVAPILARTYHLAASGSGLFRLIALSLVATTAMVPSQIEMERHLDFSRLAIIETVQALCFNAVAVIMAWKGFGAISFGVALMTRSLVGAILANLMQPAYYGWLLKWNLAKPHLKFGVYYQSSQLLSMVKDSITPLLIGYLVGSVGVGYLSWAAMLAAYPVLLLMVLQRLYLPAFAKFRGDPVHTGRFLEQVLWATNAIAAPFAVALLILIHPVTVLIFGNKWLTSIPLFYFFWTANLFVPTATPIGSILNSSGRANLGAAFAAMWMILTWVLGWPLALWKGILGIAMATALVQLSNLIMFKTAQKIVPFHILRTIRIPWVLATLMGLLLLAVTKYQPITNFLWLVIDAVGALTLYAAVLVLCYRQRVKRIVTTNFGVSKNGVQAGGAGLSKL